MNVNNHASIFIKRVMVYGVSILNLLIFMFSSDIFRNESMFSLCAKMMLAISILSILYALIKTRAEVHYFHNMILFFGMAFCGGISYFLHPDGSFYDFCVMFGGYLAIPAYILTVPHLDYNKKDGIWFKVISSMYLLFFLYGCFLKPSYNLQTEALTLGFSNSNYTGLYLMLILILFLLAFRDVTKKRSRLLFALIGVVLLLCIIKTQCRTAFIIAAICFLYYLIPHRKKTNKRFSVVCLLFPAFFLIFYVYIFSKGWFSSLTVFDRPIFSGRQVLFMAEMHPISLFGDYANSHFNGLNYVLSVTNSLGLIGIFLYCWYMIRFLISDYLDICDDGYSKSLVRFFFSIMLIHGSTERLLFNGGSVFAGMVLCILMVGFCNKYKERE